MNKKLSLLLSLVLLLSFTALPLLAETFSPCFTYISSCSATISVNGSSIKSTGIVSGTSPTSITVSLQKQNTNGTWSTLKSWSSSGTIACSASESYSVSSGTYRVKVVGKANGESTTVYSPTKYL